MNVGKSRPSQVGHPFTGESDKITMVIDKGCISGLRLWSSKSRPNVSGVERSGSKYAEFVFLRIKDAEWMR